MRVLNLTDIQRINTLVKRDLLNVEEVVAATGFDPVDVDAVLRGVYVADLACQWKDDAAITLEEYNAIRKRWKPGRGHWDTAYAIARDFLIRPETVLAIAHSRFSNAHTHPMPKAVKAKAENESLHPAVNPDLYVNLDEQREGYAPIESRGWDVLTQNLTGKGRTDPSQTLNQNPKQRPRGSVGERRWLRKRGLL